MGTSAGYAVIVEGKIPGAEGLASHNKTANRMYQTLIDRGFAEQNIFYFNFYFDGPESEQQDDPTAQTSQGVPIVNGDANRDGILDRLQPGVGMDAEPTKQAIADVLTSNNLGDDAEASSRAEPANFATTVQVPFWLIRIPRRSTC